MQSHLEARPASSVQACRSCGSRDLAVFLDLGNQPIANALLDEAHLADEEPRFPLQLAFCKGCALVQVTETVAPDILFGRDYPYFSSYSPALLAHSREHVSRILRERPLDSGSLVVEVASNDGYLLSNFVEAGVPVLGIDPAAGPVEAALQRGVPTWQAFFGAGLARDLAASGKQADVLIANNVAAHVDTINDFIEGIAILLKDDGFARIEVAYLRDLIEKCEFDTIYHEHLFYHSVTAFEPLLRRHGLHLNDVERIAIHGGSIRLTASKKPGRTERLEELLEEEAALGMGEIYYYQSFAERVEGVRWRLREWIGHKHDDGARLAGYGAAAKGATLLNYVQFDPGTVEYVVDRNPAKVGKYMPGVKLPICAVETLLTDRPHFLLLLAWNFASEIMRQNKAYIDLGGRFILPNV